MENSEQPRSNILMSNYCPRIHHGLTLTEVSNNSLSYSACCWAKESISTLNKIEWHHPALIHLREQNQKKLLPFDYCSSCIQQEKTNKKSMRQGYAEIHGPETYTPTLQYLDINIDYTCNLACISCGPELSTTWRNELKLKNLVVRPKIDNFLSALQELDLRDLKEIRFWGGEPFLTKTYQHILEFVVDNFDPNKIKLMFNTNGTCRIDRKTQELLEKFNFVRISFSIDAIGKKFEYIRYPGNWNQVQSNLMWWKENLPHNAMLSLTVTASLLNVLDLNDIFEWQQKNFSESKFGDPIEIFVHQAFGITGLENMTLAMAEHLRGLNDYCQPWIQQLRLLASKKDGPDQFLNYIEAVDRRREMYLCDALPDVHRFMRS